MSITAKDLRGLADQMEQLEIVESTYGNILGHLAGACAVAGGHLPTSTEDVPSQKWINLHVAAQEGRISWGAGSGLEGRCVHVHVDGVPIERWIKEPV